MKSITSAVFALAVWSTTAVSTDAFAVAPDADRPWLGQPPVDCPFPKSDTLASLGFTDRHAEYTQADTWYPSWAADGNLYSPWTDGVVNGLRSDSADKGTYPEATTGYATHGSGAKLRNMLRLKFI